MQIESKNNLPKGSYFIGIGGIIVGVAAYVFAANVVTELISECMQKGSSFEFCQQNGVKWPLVYLAYGFTGFMVLIGMINLFLPKKN